MLLSNVLVPALLAAGTTALPMPKPHLSLDAVTDFVNHVKRDFSSDFGLSSFANLQEKATQGDQATPNYQSTSGGGLCMGNDNACVTGGGQIS